MCESRGGRLGLPIPSKPTVSVDVKQHSIKRDISHPVPNKPYGFCGRQAPCLLTYQISELRSCVKVEVAVLGSPCPCKTVVVLTVSVDVKQHGRRRKRYR